jgi:hypothetical protein
MSHDYAPPPPPPDRIYILAVNADAKAFAVEFHLCRAFAKIPCTVVFKGNNFAFGGVNVAPFAARFCRRQASAEITGAIIFKRYRYFFFGVNPAIFAFYTSRGMFL